MPATLDQVRELSMALPEVLESTSYGTTAYKVRGKLFVRVLDDSKSIVVKVDLDERDAMVESMPTVFSVTPHYQGYPMVIVRLATVKRTLLRDLLAQAWRRVAPKTLLVAFDASATK